MAPVKRCPVCHQVMYAIREQSQQHGTWVTYHCRNYDCREFVKTDHRWPYEETVFIPNEPYKVKR